MSQDPEADAKPVAERSRLIRWTQRKPKAALGTTAAVCLFVGIGIGGSSTEDTKTQDELRSVKAKLTKAEGQKRALSEESEKKDERIAKLSAKGEVPDLTAGTVDEAKELVSDYDWKLKITRKPSGRKPGTILSQSVREGKTLKAGRSITLVLAKKRPPKPKQWITVKTLTGASSTKTEQFKIPSGTQARLRYWMPTSGNNAITLYRAPKEYVDLLLNEIGPQSGTTRLYEPGTFYLDVTGAYTINVQLFKRPG